MSRDYITESFLAGELNEAWRYLEFCRHVLPGTEADIQQLKNVILRYATVTPYPLLEDEGCVRSHHRRYPCRNQFAFAEPVAHHRGKAPHRVLRFGRRENPSPR